MPNRQRAYLRQRYRVLLHSEGTILITIGLLNIIPVFLWPFFPDQSRDTPGFLLSGIPLIAIGWYVHRQLEPRGPVEHIRVQEGAVIVVGAWLIGIFSGTIPFMIEADLNFSQAVFEATSAWTTTGLSVVDVESASPLILFYRSLLQLAGGAGLAIITMSAIAGPIGYGLSIAEGRGEQLAPHIRDSTNIVLSLYAGYVIFGIGALYVTGMSLFDAVNHSFSALSTGGFSTRVESIGYWDSPGVEAATILLMLLGTINFLTAYTLLRGRFRAVLKNGELRLMVALSALVVPSLFFIVTYDLYASAGKALRVAIFETISAMSTTGFSTVGYTDWPDFGWLMLALLMIIGGGTGSTAGGIKQYRIYILYKAIIWELKKSFMPAHMVNEPAVWRGDRRHLLSDYQVRQVALFIGLYGTVFVLGSAIMTAYGYSLHETFFEFASSLGTVGLSVGVTAPNMPFAVMWTQIVAMILGRLEFFAVLVGIFKLIGDCRVMFSR